jgi:hypothetical protein
VVRSPAGARHHRSRAPCLLPRESPLELYEECRALQRAIGRQMFQDLGIRLALSGSGYEAEDPRSERMIGLRIGAKEWPAGEWC